MKKFQIALQECVDTIPLLREPLFWVVFLIPVFIFTNPFQVAARTSFALPHLREFVTVSNALNFIFYVYAAYYFLKQLVEALRKKEDWSISSAKECFNKIVSLFFIYGAVVFLYQLFGNHSGGEFYIEASLYGVIEGLTSLGFDKQKIPQDVVFVVSAVFLLAAKFLFNLLFLYITVFLFMKWIVAVSAVLAAKDTIQVPALSEGEHKENRILTDVILLCKNQISSLHKRQVTSIVLMISVTLISAITFSSIFGRSALFEVQKSAKAVNSHEVARVIAAAPYNERMEWITKSLEEYEAGNHNNESTRKFVDGLKRRLDHLPELSSQHETLTNQISNSTVISEFKDLSETLVENMGRIPPVDWESIFIRAAVFIFCLYLLKMFYGNFLYTRDRIFLIEEKVIMLSALRDSNQPVDSEILNILRIQEGEKKDVSEHLKVDDLVDLLMRLAKGGGGGK